MELKDQVVSLELAREMKELGFEQESLWYWCRDQIEGWERPFLLQGHGMHKEYYSAYTVAELGEMLPLEIKTDRAKHINGNVLYWCEYAGYEEISANTEANARASMLCYLKENKLI